jgi:hypothetical protein
MLVGHNLLLLRDFEPYVVIFINVCYNCYHGLVTIYCMGFLASLDNALTVSTVMFLSRPS